MVYSNKKALDNYIHNPYSCAFTYLYTIFNLTYLKWTMQLASNQFYLQYTGPIRLYA